MKQRNKNILLILIGITKNKHSGLTTCFHFQNKIVSADFTVQLKVSLFHVSLAAKIRLI